MHSGHEVIDPAINNAEENCFQCLGFSIVHAAELYQATEPTQDLQLLKYRLLCVHRCVSRWI